jgi:hypothetical protein
MRRPAGLASLIRGQTCVVKRAKRPSWLEAKDAEGTRRKSCRTCMWLCKMCCARRDGGTNKTCLHVASARAVAVTLSAGCVVLQVMLWVGGHVAASVGERFLIIAIIDRTLQLKNGCPHWPPRRMLVRYAPPHSTRIDNPCRIPRTFFSRLDAVQGGGTRACGMTREMVPFCRLLIDTRPLRLRHDATSALISGAAKLENRIVCRTFAACPLSALWLHKRGAVSRVRDGAC